MIEKVYEKYLDKNTCSCGNRYTTYSDCRKLIAEARSQCREWARKVGTYDLNCHLWNLANLLEDAINLEIKNFGEEIGGRSECDNDIGDNVYSICQLFYWDKDINEIGRA